MIIRQLIVIICVLTFAVFSPNAAKYIKDSNNFKRAKRLFFPQTKISKSFISHYGSTVPKGGFSFQSSFEQSEPLPHIISISGAPSYLGLDINGDYSSAGTSANGIHYIRKFSSNNDNKYYYLHIFRANSQWILFKSSETSVPSDLTTISHNILAYSTTTATMPISALTNWLFKSGKSFDSLPCIKIVARKSDVDHHDDNDLPRNNNGTETSFLYSLTKEKEVLGIPRNLLPYYVAFALDAIAVGLVMPLLPFTVMELGANAFQLSLVVSSNYIAQSIGVTVMGRISDSHGRKLVMTLCLLASTLSYLFLAQAESLIGVALARIISGSFGGLIPIIQSAVADSTTQIERPKYLGRIMATFGLGFVLGPALSALLMGWTTRQKIRLAGLLPFLGFLLIFFVAKETKKNARPFDLYIPFLSDCKLQDKLENGNNVVEVDTSNKNAQEKLIHTPQSTGRKLWRMGSNTSTPGGNSNNESSMNINSFPSIAISSVHSSSGNQLSNRATSPTPLASRALTPSKSTPSFLSPSNNSNSNVGKELIPTPFEIYLLVLNGFCIMFAFATETIYAMFIKDSFGYGEAVLSTIFAINGLFIGLFQIFFIKPVIHAIGKHATLAIGNIMLALGMIGVALVRDAKSIHFAFFAAHIVGYSIADTTLAALISKYSSPSTQGRDLALNQAAQACARVVSPVIAGVLYEYSKRVSSTKVSTASTIADLIMHILPSGALPFLVGAICPLVALTIPTYLYWQKRARKRRQLALFTAAAAPDTTTDISMNNTINKPGWRGIAPRWLQPSDGSTSISTKTSMNSIYDFAVSSDSNSDAEGPGIGFH